MSKANYIIGNTFYVTSKYSKNIPFKVHSSYGIDGALVDTWEGRNSVTQRPMGRVKNSVYTLSHITMMLETGILSETRTN